ETRFRRGAGWSATPREHAAMCLGGGPPKTRGPQPLAFCLQADTWARAGQALAQASPHGIADVKHPDGFYLVEREQELSELASLFDDLPERGSIAVIQGPAGIGKTSLLQACRREALARNCHSLGARGLPLEREFPHGVVRQLFERQIELSGGARAPFH